MDGKMYHLQLTVCQHTDSISYADADLYPNVHVILKHYRSFSVNVRDLALLFGASKRGVEQH